MASFDGLQKQQFFYKPNTKITKPMSHFFCLRGDLAAIRRISVEFCEDVARNGTLYVEARFCPQLLMDEKHPEVTANHIIDVVLDGFKEGEATYGIKVNLFVVLPSHCSII